MTSKSASPDVLMMLGRFRSEEMDPYQVPPRDRWRHGNPAFLRFIRFFRVFSKRGMEMFNFFLQPLKWRIIVRLFSDRIRRFLMVDKWYSKRALKGTQQGTSHIFPEILSVNAKFTPKHWQLSRWYEKYEVAKEKLCPKSKVAQKSSPKWKDMVACQATLFHCSLCIVNYCCWAEKNSEFFLWQNNLSVTDLFN